ncbi:hypothetical protein BRADI_4g10338v3 [Brachypodium distachyon]|uniref:Uncharacterized protein n=1 Tax=Brachypodium distachyon TaxID=15368 RepID=A0A0Q3L3Z2_BRADI|nr:hypothetical protein BRADI_4g10338v3 [Brachypodium distachyon]
MELRRRRTQNPSRGGRAPSPSSPWSEADAAILRCRAVCRSWRRLASDPAFRLAHHRRQPSLPLFVLRGFSSNPANLERVQPLLGFDDHDDNGRRGRFKLHASCDGLLLLSNCRYLSLCNPATRQHAPVPGLNTADCDYMEALYLHRASGVPGARKPSLPRLGGLCQSLNPRPPVMIRGCLHWDPNSYALAGVVAVFDTVAESFKSMRLPVAATVCCTCLHDMEGMLGLSCFDESGTVAEVWVLDDYEREVWSLEYKINFSSDSMCSLAKRHLVLSHEGDMLLYSNSGSHMVHYERKFLEKFQWESWASTLTGHLFKESLVNHAFFLKPCSAPTVEHRCLFTRL